MKKLFLFSFGVVTALSLFFVSCDNGDNDNYTGDDDNSTPTTYEAVDLGLPSGLKWASCNIGATAPEEYGSYFAWGETEEKTIYEWENYKYSGDTPSSMFKYCTSDSYGICDGKDVLDPEDDVARAEWGGDWRMPTNKEQLELVDNCDWEWTARNGVNGFVVKSRVNNNSIFIPAAGYYSGDELYMLGKAGTYLSCDLRAGIDRAAFVLYFYSGGPSAYTSRDRCDGNPVRPVCK